MIAARLPGRGRSADGKRASGSLGCGTSPGAVAHEDRVDAGIPVQAFFERQYHEHLRYGPRQFRTRPACSPTPGADEVIHGDLKLVRGTGHMDIETVVIDEDNLVGPPGLPASPYAGEHLAQFEEQEHRLPEPEGAEPGEIVMNSPAAALSFGPPSAETWMSG